MNRHASMDFIYAALHHLLRYPDVLAELAAGRRFLMVSDSGSMGFARPDELTVGWREIGRASDLMPFMQAIAKFEADAHRCRHKSKACRKLLRYGWLMIGLHRSYDLLVDLHQDAVNPKRRAKVPA